MNVLYAPWRSSFAQGNSKNQNTTDNSCTFCEKLASSNDTQHFILKRMKHCFIILNRYPYNAGHLLILPLTHASTLDKVTLETRTQMMEAINHCSLIVSSVLQAQGVNVGINTGQASGGSLPEHLHIHVLPRWTGDTNFLPLLANTKVVSFDLEEIYQRLAPHFENLG